MVTYSDWYSDPGTNGNIPSGISLGEYVYTKHHDVRGYSDFYNAPGKTIYGSVMDDDALNLLDVGMPPGEGEGEAGHLCVDPYSYIGDGSAMDAEPVGCIKLREEGDFTSVYIDYALKAQLNDTERRNIVDADPAGAFYIY